MKTFDETHAPSCITGAVLVIAACTLIACSSDQGDASPSGSSNAPAQGSSSAVQDASSGFSPGPNGATALALQDHSSAKAHQQDAIVEELSFSSSKEITGSQRYPDTPPGLSPWNGADVEAIIETDTTSPKDGGDEDGGPATEPRVNRFVSLNTDGFQAQLENNGAVRVQWKQDPEARGYNVYRDSKYYTTVFDNSFVDQKVVDTSYYYEIHAFDHNDRFSVVATGLTVEVHGTGQEKPEPRTASKIDLDDYTLVFADEFSGRQLDRSKWTTRFLWGPDLIINSEDQYYIDKPTASGITHEPFVMDGETLTITAVPTPDDQRAAANDQPYLSGIITSYDSFQFTYGYVEASARMPFGRGLWPAFWLLNAYYVGAKPEIDIMEFIGHDQDVVYHTYHYFDHQDRLHSSHSAPTTGMDFTNGFHTYGVEWSPGLLIFYVNGVEQHRISDPNVSNQEMYVIANLALGGWWAGAPDDSTPFPARYSLDYIRVYQKNGHMEHVPFNDDVDFIPYADTLIDALPNRRPSPVQWPDGYLYSD